MTLGEVLSGVGLKQPLAPALAAQEASGLDYDSRRVEPGYLFFAFPGARADGRRLRPARWNAAPSRWLAKKRRANRDR